MAERDVAAPAGVDREQAARMHATQEGYRGSTNDVVLRSREEIHALLGGLDLVDPGMVELVHWPRESPGRCATGAYAAVARLP